MGNNYAIPVTKPQEQNLNLSFIDTQTDLSYLHGLCGIITHGEMSSILRIEEYCNALRKCTAIRNEFDVIAVIEQVYKDLTSKGMSRSSINRIYRRITRRLSMYESSL